MTLKYFNVKNGLSTGNITLHSGNANVEANTFIGNISVTSTANLGDIANLKIAGGTSGYVIQTDGQGNLSWTAQTGGGNQQLPDVVVDSFIADGSNNSFTLSTTPSNKDYLMVNVDGVFQFGDSYTIAGNALSFGSIPLTDSVIEVRTLIPGSASGGSGNSITNGSSNVKVFSNSIVAISSNGTANVFTVSSNTVTVSANIVPSSNVTYNLGNSTNRFKDIYLSGNTINLGNAIIKTDDTSGALILVPQPTVSTPNPVGIVITSTGTFSTVNTTGGSFTTSDISNSVGISVNYASTAYVDTAISNLVNSAPSALDTLKELASALGNDASYSTTITNVLANKLNSNAFTYANLTGKPTLGNISTINTDGNASNILYGNGVFSSAPVTYSNSNVATFLASFGSNTISTTGNVTVGNIIATNVGNLASINKDGNSSNILYGNGVFAAVPAAGASITAYANIGAFPSANNGSMAFALDTAILYIRNSSAWIAVKSSNPQYINLNQPGTITVPYTGTARYYPKGNITISNVYAYLGTPSNSTMTFNLYKNGSNIGAYTISANAYTMSVVSANIALTSSDYLTLGVSAGSGASDLKVDLQYS